VNRVIVPTKIAVYVRPVRLDPVKFCLGSCAPRRVSPACCVIRADPAIACLRLIYERPMTAGRAPMSSLMTESVIDHARQADL
jgi:hypothetical protein